MELSMGQKRRVHSRDHRYTIDMERTYSHAVDFRVYATMDGADGSEPTMWLLVDENGADRPVDATNEATRFMYGSVKWDGCMNFDFDEPGMLHLCGPNDVASLASMMHEVMAMAAAAMPDVCSFADEVSRPFVNTVRP